jgi:DNA-binding transcriptional regulator YiaG
VQRLLPGAPINLAALTSLLSDRSRNVYVGDMMTDLVKLSSVRAKAEAGTARSIRVAAGLSLREVADELGVGASTVFRWEKGERRPRGNAALRYADLLEALQRRTP